MQPAEPSLFVFPLALSASTRLATYRIYGLPSGHEILSPVGTKLIREFVISLRAGVARGRNRFVSSFRTKTFRKKKLYGRNRGNVSTTSFRRLLTFANDGDRLRFVVCNASRDYIRDR